MQDFKSALQNALNQSQEKQMQTRNTNPEHLTALAKNWDREEREHKIRLQGSTLVGVRTVDEEESNKGKNLVTTNVSRATFAYVRDNPNKTKVEITNELSKLGYNASSVSTLVSQMVRGDIAVADEEGRVSTMFKEYRPIKNGSAIIKMKKKKRIKAASSKSGRPTREGIAALKIQDAPVIPKLVSAPTPAKSNFDADKLLSTLSFADVLVLHKKIKAMLGDA
jgi:hypothetical protein